MKQDLLIKTGQRIRQQRLLADLTQGDLAREFGCVQSAISAIEKGDNRPSLEFLVWFSERTGAPLEYLVTGKGQPVKPETPEGISVQPTEALAKVVTDIVNYLVEKGREGTEPVIQLLKAYGLGEQAGSAEESRLLNAFRNLPSRRRKRLIEDAEEFAAAFAEGYKDHLLE